MSKSDTLEIGAAYVRVSTDDQTELSPDAQVRVIMEAAKADGYVIPQDFIFIEHKGISGRRSDNRPEFQRMVAIAKSQYPAPFRRLYVWKFSRFARNQEESTFYKGILRKKCGVEIKSVSEPIMEGMFGRLIETIIEWFDEYYSINLSEEVRRGMTEKVLRNGYQLVPCLGYKALGHGQPYLIDEEKYPYVEYIFRAYHDGLDMTQIARQCNSRGWRTRRGNPFERRTIQRILNNKFYIGIVEWNGYSFQGTHEVRSTVTDLWEDNQKRLAAEYRPIRRREASSCQHWLSGLLKCAVCDATLSFSRASSPKRRSDIFQCWKYAKGFHPGSNSVAVRIAENAVLESLRKVLESRELDYEVVTKTDEKISAEEALLTDALARIQIKEQRVRDAYENGIDTLEEYKANKLRLAAEKTELTNQLESLKCTDIEVSPPGKEEVLARIRRAYDILSDPDVDFETKGNALRRVVKKIVYDRQENTFSFYYYA